MTLKDARELAQLVAKWCLEQDDLKAFRIVIGDLPDRPLLRVTLDWPNGWGAMKDYHLPARLDDDSVFAPLEALAVLARKRAARIADPNRLPG